MMRPEIKVDDQDGDNPDKIYFDKYLTKAYKNFLAGIDEYSEPEQELLEESDRRNELTLLEIDRLEEERQKLSDEIEHVLARQQPLEKSEEMRQTLLSDQRKFNERIKKLEQKRIKGAATNTELEQKIQEAEFSYQEMGEKKVQLQRQVDAQDISATDVEKMNFELVALDKSLAIAAEESTELTTRLTQRDRQAQDQMNDLDKVIQTYNAMAEDINRGPVGAARTRAMIDKINFPNPVEDNRAWLGKQPQDLLNIDLRGNIKPALSQMRESLASDVHKHQKEIIRQEELLDQVNEGLKDKKEELDALEAKLQATNDEVTEIRDTTAAESLASNAQIETMAAELATMKNTAQNGRIQLEAKAQSISIEYGELLRESSIVRGDLVSKYYKALEDIVEFKTHIQVRMTANTLMLERVRLIYLRNLWRH